MDAEPRFFVVTFISDPFDPPGHERFGGGHLFLFDLARYLVRNHYLTTFVTRLNSPNKPTHENLGGFCDVHRLPVGPPEEISLDKVAELLDPLSDGLVRLVRVESDCETLVIHSNYWIEGEAALRVARACGARHVHSILSLGRIKRELGETPTPADDFRDACELRVFSTADALIAVCPDEAKGLIRLYPEISHAPLSIVPYPIDDDVFYPRPASPDDYVRRATGRLQKGASR